MRGEPTLFEEETWQFFATSCWRRSQPALFAFVPSGYPNKPVKIVVATGAGTVDDLPARIVADKLSGILGQQFFVENRPGAGGSIGQTFVMKSPPDGYTLLLAGGSMAGARYANANVTYDLLKDFTPISLLLTSEFALVVNPALPVRDVKELIAYAKANPGKVTYGTIGAGQMPYWNVMLFNSLTGVRVVEVPYKATPEFPRTSLPAAWTITSPGSP